MFKAASFATLALVLSLATATGAAPSSNDNPLCELPRYCTPEQVINCIKSVKFEQAYYKNVVNDIITLLDPYVFTDILKNPPQPEGFTDYFEPVDLIAELREINTNPATFYEFYRSVKRVLNSVQDGHLMHFFVGSDKYDHKLVDFYGHLPLDLYTTSVNGEGKVMGELINETLYSHFKDGADIKAIVTKNLNVPIKKINEMEPPEFIFSFGSEYYNFLKNRDAKYTYANSHFSQLMSLYEFPLEISDFTNISIEYENGDKFTTDFLFLNADPAKDKGKNDNKMRFTEYVRRRAQDIALAGLQLDLNKLLKEWENDEEVKKPLTEKEIIEQLRSIDIKELKRRPQKRSARTDGWDRGTLDGVLKCRVDTTNKVNVFFINSFYPDDTTDYSNVLVECTQDIEKNDYPIIVIDDMNTGGAIIFSYFFQEILQHDIIARGYASYKNDPKLRKAMDYLGFYSSIQDTDTCTSYSSINELFYDTEVDDYGNGIFHNRTVPVFLEQFTASFLRVSMEDEYKKARKPTEIVVFTDSFSFSAGSILTKGLKESGAAIIAGYNGYPGSPKETFDIGQSPTNCLQASLEEFDKVAYNRLSENGVLYASVSIGETFRVRDVQMRGNSTEPLIPREFLFDAPDERTAIYGGYDESRYDEFISAGKAILEKYKTECNPANPRLHMRDAACDSIINKTHMHGGYTCGADGKWSTVCEGYYCDNGYVYDAGTDSCIEDTCYIEALKINDTVSFIILIVIIAIVLVLIIAMIIICCCCIRCQRRRRQYKFVEMQYQEAYGGEDISKQSMTIEKS